MTTPGSPPGAGSRRCGVPRSAAPTCVHPAEILERLEIRAAVPADVGELLTVQRAAFVTVQQENPEVGVTELTEGPDRIASWSQEGLTLVATSAGRLVGFARAKLREGRWRVARLAVVPDLQGRGIGGALLSAVESAAPAEADGFTVMAGAGSAATLRFYRRAGYRPRGEVAPGVVRLDRPRR